MTIVTNFKNNNILLDGTINVLNGTTLKLTVLTPTLLKCIILKLIVNQFKVLKSTTQKCTELQSTNV